MLYERKLNHLKTLLKLERTGLIEVFFADESGFSLEPCIPYGWLPIGKQVSICSSQAKVGNVFGLLSRSGTGYMHWTKENINSRFVGDCLDRLTQDIQRPTVVVLDNAPWHRCHFIEQKIPHWQKKGLFIFYLPPYSPHLNLIEILWRKIKYEWLETQDYTSAEHLRNAVLNILKNLGNTFNINFNQNELLSV